MKRANAKLIFMWALVIFSIGIATGTVLTADEQLDNLTASEQTINEKVEKALDEKFAKEQANMQLYVMSADDVDTGERVHFYFRSDDNPFWRAHEIMEIEKINFENLAIRESDFFRGAKHVNDRIIKLQDKLAAEDYHNNPVGNLSVKLNADASEVMTELVQVESKLERINHLLGEINGKFKNENTIKIGVEVNE